MDVLYENGICINDETIARISALDEIIIYGAGVMGRALKLCLESEPYNKRVCRFIVNDINRNPKMIGNVPVIALDKADEYKDRLIIVALNESHMPVAVETLNKRGFQKLIMLNAAGDVWMDIKAFFFLHNQDKCYIPFKMLPGITSTDDCGGSVTVYVVKSIFDKVLGDSLPIRSYEQEIHVGAALTDKRICDLTDFSGENISEKNQQYCELTALYWIWKHCDSDYIGISHYRRRFDISEDVVRRLHELNTDVIVTVPVINTAGIGNQYGITHSAKDWEILRDEIHQSCPEYDDSFSTVEKQIYFHAYNMFIMRKDILRSFCDWMFPILFACNKRIGVKEDAYQNRYPGFLSERLLNVFLYKNREIFNIFVANKRYLS
ncbi:DUF4422 domain-containing protein [Butyrivibrio sp. FCS006]|uniref:DUF4422 domain-containing protein n=1 Tax=Butyrivibrio sp. FCS006 TaxID=1280684 RepID=UPI000404AC7E|nr:DUF4422 domain-containing protein [Butyrivibrio sp. FCS006]